jgi:hypothetical protein
MAHEARVQSWWSVASSPDVVRRALLLAVVVGAILIGINHGDAILAGDVGAGRASRMLLTAIVPYVVSTVSSVGALRQREKTVAEHRGGMARRASADDPSAVR